MYKNYYAFIQNGIQRATIDRASHEATLNTIILLYIHATFVQYHFGLFLCSCIQKCFFTAASDILSEPFLLIS